MTIQIELNSEAESQLEAVAQVSGVAPAAYAGTLLHEILTAVPTKRPKLTVDEFHVMLGELAQGSESLPNLPVESFTRESFYEDRE